MQLLFYSISIAIDCDARARARAIYFDIPITRNFRKLRKKISIMKTIKKHEKARTTIRKIRNLSDIRCDRNLRLRVS